MAHLVARANAVLAALAVLVSLQHAHAQNSCVSGMPPVIGAYVTCSVPGEDLIPIPQYATNAELDIRGADGMYGIAPVGGTPVSAGRGAQFYFASGVSWPAGTAYLRVIVGRAGRRLNETYGAGTGGGATALIALDSALNFLALIAMMGGGGGGGFRVVDGQSTPYGGPGNNFDAPVTWNNGLPATQLPAGGGNGAFNTSTYLPFFSTGYTYPGNSSGAGGLTSPVLLNAPAWTSASSGMLFKSGGVVGVDIFPGQDGTSRTGLGPADIAAGGEPVAIGGQYCSGGGGAGWSGGASGGALMLPEGCSGSGGSGGTYYLNLSLVPTPGQNYGLSNGGQSPRPGLAVFNGTVSIKFFAPPTSSTTPSPSVTASNTGSTSATPSMTGSTSATPSVSGSATMSPVSPSVSSSLSMSPSVSGSFSVTPSVSSAATMSSSGTPSATASVSITASLTASTSITASVSLTPSMTSSASVTASRTGSASVSATRTGSLSASPSREPSVTASETRSASVSASASGSPSNSASTSATASRSASRSVSTSPSATPSETPSVSGTPSETLTSTETGTMTSSATMTMSATATRSSSGTPGVIVPALSLSLTLVGGDEDALRAGTGTLLRQAVNELVGVDGASTSFTALVTNYTVAEVQDVYGLANATANATRANASSIMPGSSQIISPTDPELNAPLRRRRLQPAQASCNPVVLPSNGTLTVLLTTAYMMVQIPPSYFTTNGAYSAAQIAALIAQLQTQFYLQLANPAVITTAMSSFTQAWSTCTGMPDSVGVIAAIAAPAAVNVPTPTPVPGPDNSAMRNGVLIGVITGGLFILLVIALAMGCSRRRSLFAANKDAFMFLGGAHECELSQVWDWPIRVPAAGGDANAPAWAIRACPHVTLRYTASLALRAAGLEVNEELLARTSLQFRDRTFTVRDSGASPLGDLEINVNTAHGTEGVLLLAAGAVAVDISSTTAPQTATAAAIAV